MVTWTPFGKQQSLVPCEHRQVGPHPPRGSCEAGILPPSLPLRMELEMRKPRLSDRQACPGLRGRPSVPQSGLLFSFFLTSMG